MICQQCGKKNDPDAVFCVQCSQPLIQSCPSCSTQNPGDARFCKKCRTELGGVSEAAQASKLQDLRASSSQIEGERKPVTILFTDIVSSTAIAEKLDPEEWKEIVNSTHRRVSEAVYRYEGIIAQLLGDGVLAFFGAPITHEDDPIRAVHAALDIQEAIGHYAQELQGYVDNLQMRVGVNSGTVVVGAVGDDLHMEYLAVGDSVNLAARLQSAAEPGGVLISEATARLVESVFDLQDLSQMTIKGKAEPVQVYAVLEPKSVAESARGVEGLRSPLVGRVDEFAALQAALKNLRDGRGQIVYVLGEAGIGKTRLVEEVRQTKEGRVRWLEGRSLSYGQSLSFWTITQLIKSDLGLSDTDLEVKIMVALRRRVKELFQEDPGTVLPYLSHLLGLRLEGEMAERVEALDGETLKRQTLLSINKYVTQLANEEPTILVFEDLHWADASTLEALEGMLTVTNSAPFMLLLVGRIDRDHGSWRIKLKAETDFAHRYTEIQLRSFSTEESNQLVDNLLAIAELPDDVRGRMLDRSEGNPFYLEEVIRSLIDQGALVLEEDRWRATRALDELEIPDTLNGVLLARIDRLEEDVRRTLQTASVIGKSFIYRLLEAIAEAERELDQHLAQLQRVDLVRENRRLPELEYIFKHSLTQEAAYNSLLVERRKEFHLKVGEAVERLFPDRKEEFLGLLAHHFYLGGHSDKAVSYLLEAGDKARYEDALEEAIPHYQRAIDVLTEVGEEARAAETWLKLGLVYHIDFRFEEAHRANETAFGLQQKTATPRRRQDRRIDASELVFRIGIHRSFFETLDPGKSGIIVEGFILDEIFAGMAKIDLELNLSPHAASSWEVLEEGKRYIIHLRDDVLWTDGTQVTAPDFEWTLKRNLAPEVQSQTASLLDVIVGAREFRTGRSLDPEGVAVRALDSYTLEIELSSPVAYFPYLLAHPVMLPLPRTVVERHGDGWWKPEHIISNGAYRLTEFDPTGRIAMERNSDYFGSFAGNVERIEWWIIEDHEERERLFREGQHAYLYVPVEARPPDLAHLELGDPTTLSTTFIALAPVPPLDDVRVRRALIHALDRSAMAKTPGLRPLPGGMVPSGMPGHSPDLGLPYDLTLARRLLTEAGYSEGRGFPMLRGHKFSEVGFDHEIARQWQEGLGIEAKIELSEHSAWYEGEGHISIGGWVADFPDPDNFLRNTIYLDWLRSKGWQDPTYDELVERAAQTPDRMSRMSMYREADRDLVEEKAHLIPVEYSREAFAGYLQPWIKGFRWSALNRLSIKDVIIEPH